MVPSPLVAVREKKDSLLLLIILLYLFQLFVLRGQRGVLRGELAVLRREGGVALLHRLGSECWVSERGSRGGKSRVSEG